MYFLLELDVFSSGKQVIGVKLVLASDIRYVLGGALFCGIIIFIFLCIYFYFLSFWCRLLFIVLLFLGSLDNFLRFFEVARKVWGRNSHFVIRSGQSVEFGIEGSGEVNVGSL